MNKELMPCPFCGSVPLVNIIEPHKHSWAEMPDHPGSCVIECGCGAGLIDDTQGLVSNRWNTRAGSSSEPTQLEKAPQPEWVHLEFTGKETIATSLYTSPPEVAELQKQVQALQAENKLFRTAIDADPTFGNMKPDLDLIDLALEIATNSTGQNRKERVAVQDAIAALKRLKGDV